MPTLLRQHEPALDCPSFPPFDSVQQESGVFLTAIAVFIIIIFSMSRLYLR